MLSLDFASTETLGILSCRVLLTGRIYLFKKIVFWFGKKNIAQSVYTNEKSLVVSEHFCKVNIFRNKDW